ncbi:MAG: hypothetical protein NWE75_01715 [Candidatus Bathyarchaeota archaeon]|nr:hypothetical protein [Candidatus Bathyarchaeota archaeon]
MSRSYVKIYGPPVIKAIEALEAVAVDMSKATGLKFSHKCIPYPTRMQLSTSDWDQYLKNMQRLYVDCYEPVRLISDSHQLLGEYDFFFEWAEEPSIAQIEGLLKKIDDALEGLGCNYTLTTK